MENPRLIKLIMGITLMVMLLVIAFMAIVIKELLIVGTVIVLMGFVGYYLIYLPSRTTQKRK